MVGVAPAGGADAEKVPCKLCNQRLSRSKIRIHVGGHILKDKAMQVSTVYGFCGGLGCHTTINAPSGKAAPVIHSTCPYASRKDARDSAVQLSLKSARVGSDTSPCTNIVLKCIFCFQETYILKYGMADHVARCHNEDTLVEAGTERAKKFKDYTVSEMEESKVLKKFKAGKLRPRRDTGSLPPGARRSVSGNGAVGSGVPLTRPQGEQEEEEENGYDDEEDDEDEDQEDQYGGRRTGGRGGRRAAGEEKAMDGE